jgi:anti-sigma regulatory factor (Ser/Thr protein kinase)
MSNRSGLFPAFLAALSETPAPLRTPPARFATAAVRRRLALGNDPQAAAALVAQLRDDVIAVGACDYDAALRVSVALEEALLNAIYHGNLEISSELKENGDEPFHALARERRGLEPFASRRVRVLARVTRRRAAFVIEDDGPGFDVSKLPDPTEPDYLERPCGRGLLLMRAFMDEVRYNAAGNRVMLVKMRSSDLL